jgi:histidinol dehydrogenase
MQIICYPKKEIWNEILKRPAFETQSLEKIVSGILEDVKNNGDCAVKNYTKKFDQIELDDLQVSAEEIARAETLISDELKNALHIAQANIAKFHEAQKEKAAVIETSAGVSCWRKSVGIEKIGLYIPGGTAPLFSTAGCAQKYQYMSSLVSLLRSQIPSAERLGTFFFNFIVRTQAQARSLSSGFSESA